jgi:hypothetical protein
VAVVAVVEALVEVHHQCNRLQVAHHAAATHPFHNRNTAYQVVRVLAPAAVMIVNVHHHQNQTHTTTMRNPKFLQPESLVQV